MCPIFTRKAGEQFIPIPDAKGEKLRLNKNVKRKNPPKNISTGFAISKKRFLNSLLSLFQIEFSKITKEKRSKNMSPSQAFVIYDIAKRNEIITK